MATAAIAIPLANAAIKEALSNAVNLATNLHRKWSDYKDLEGDARAVKDRVVIVKLMVDKVSGYVQNEKEEDDNLVLEQLESIQRNLEEVERASKPLHEKLQEKAVLKRSFRFLVGSSIASNIKNLMAKLQEVENALYGIRRFETLLDNFKKRHSSSKIQDKEGREFWEKHIGKEEWSAPFPMVLEKYHSEVHTDEAYIALTAQQKESFLYALCWEEGELTVTVAQKLCPKEETVSCYRFSSFCTIYGWPFDPSALESPPQVRIVHSTAERLAVAQMCLDLQEKFFSAEMRQVMAFVRGTVDSVVAHMELELDQNTGEIQYFEEGKKRYGPYQLYKLSDRDPGDEDEQAKFKDEQTRFRAAQLKCFAADYLFRSTAEEAKDKPLLPDPDAPPDALCKKPEERPDPVPEALDKADVAKQRTLREVLDENRRIWSSAFLKFATLWKLGRLEEELFEGIDFPGTNRAITFMEYCEPLDEANLRLVIKKNLDRSEPIEAASDAQKKWKRDEASWEKSRPRVYTFLRAWIQYKHEKKSAAVSDGPGNGESGTAAAPAPRGPQLPTPVSFGGFVIPLDEDGKPRKVEPAIEPGTTSVTDGVGGEKALHLQTDGSSTQSIPSPTGPLELNAARTPTPSDENGTPSSGRVVLSEVTD